MSTPHRRYDASVQVSYDGAADFLAHYLSTISKGSLFIPSSDLHPLGTVLHIHLELPVTSTVAELAGVVAAEVSNAEQQGMLVHLLPLSDEAQAAIDTCVRIIEGKARGRVIVVHESKDYRTRVRQLLDDNGYGTITVASPRRALEVLRPGGIDLALVTTTADDMTGMQFAEHAAQLAVPLSVGVLLVAPSSRLSDDERARAKKLGVMGVMKITAKDSTIIKAIEGSFARPKGSPHARPAAPRLEPGEKIPSHDPTDITGETPASVGTEEAPTRELTPAEVVEPATAITDTSQQPPLHAEVSEPEIGGITEEDEASLTGTSNTPLELETAAAARPTMERMVPEVLDEPAYPEVVTERHQLADLLDAHMQQLGIATARTPDGRGVEGRLDLQRIKLVTPFGDGQPIPAVSVNGVGRDQLKCVAPAPMDELPPIEITPLANQEDLEKKIMGAFNRRLKSVYRVKGWLGSMDVPTHLDAQRFCCFGKSQIGGHEIVYSATDTDSALIEEINGRKLNDVMPAQERRFDLDGIRTRGDLDFRIEPFIAAAQAALVNSARGL